ncbi:MAG: YceD family protein [Gammaproteobacteria bacterium]|nr:YceD family protein [Gammaproteobacteria bacterium]
MSKALSAWYSLPDLVSLAERAKVLEGTIELSRLTRLAESLHSTDGHAKATIKLRLGRGDMLLMDLQCEAAVELVCQRCLEPVVHRIEERIQFAVAETEHSYAVLPEGIELVTLDGDRLQPAALIEDELIVSLPLVPKHSGSFNTEEI